MHYLIIIVLESFRLVLGNNKLLNAALRNDKRTINRLLQDPAINFNYHHEHGRAALYKAIEAGNVDAVRELIKNDVDLLLSRDEELNTPLHVAVRVYGGNERMVKFLLKKKVSVDAKDIHGRTPFHNAVRNNDMNTAAIIFEAGADINTVNIYGCTPLHDKVWDMRPREMEWLICNGARLDEENNYGRTPLDTAYEREARYLIEYGARISAPRYNPMEMFKKFWKEAFEFSKGVVSSVYFDAYVTRVIENFLMKMLSRKRERNIEGHFRKDDDVLTVYTNSHIFALYRILKETYVKKNFEKPSRLEQAKFATYDVITNRITEKTYLGKLPTELINDILFVSERYVWKIDRLSFYLALISHNYSEPAINAFKTDEILLFIKDYIQ